MSEEKKNIPKLEKTPNKKVVERIDRIFQNDIEGSSSIYSGLTQIKGVSWALSYASCKSLRINKNKKIGELTSEEIKKVEEFLKNPQLPQYLKNRQKDFETGEDKHLTGSDLELRKEFDIKRLKKIKSYRGFRHITGLPSRGQRTKSNFRKNRAKGAGIKKKNKAILMVMILI